MRYGLRKPSGRPVERGHKKVGGRRRGTPNRVSAEMKPLLRSVIEDPEYQAAMRERMIAGKAGHMEQLATYYTLGKLRNRFTCRPRRAWRSSSCAG